MCRHHKQQSWKHYNVQMVLLRLESWTSQWFHPARGVWYPEPRWFSEPVGQCDESFPFEWLQTSFLLMAMMSLILHLSIYLLIPNCQCDYNGCRWIIGLYYSCKLNTDLNLSSQQARIWTRISCTQSGYTYH